jgi:hypothetical protein
VIVQNKKMGRDDPRPNAPKREMFRLWIKGLRRIAANLQRPGVNHTRV